MRVIETTLVDVLRERASLQPNDKAFTYIDYEQDWNGAAESLTWSQLYRRTTNVARELERCGSPGDRAVILAPQGLDYIVGVPRRSAGGPDCGPAVGSAGRRQR